MKPEKNNDSMNHFTDYNIRSRTIRLVGEGEPIVISRDDAIEMAKSKGMNLVEIAYNKQNNPASICKIMDYSKFKYEQKKRKKELDKKNKASIADVKEISFSIRIDDGDKNTKIRHIKEFLADGDKVKISVVLARREMDKQSFAKSTMLSVLNELNGIAELDGKPKFEGRALSCIIKQIKK